MILETRIGKLYIEAKKENITKASSNDEIKVEILLNMEFPLFQTNVYCEYSL